MGKNGKPRKLPVDAYYERLKLVVEYRERQHSESVPIFDNRITISGINRKEQRKIYDQRRRDILPKHNIDLVEITFSDFDYNKHKRIIRDLSKDIEVVRYKLLKFII